MTTRPNELTTTTAPAEHQLLEQLGLGPGASNAEIEQAHDDVVAFLERAPGHLRPWARNRISEVDEAFAILRGEQSIDLGPGIAPSSPRVAPTSARPRHQTRPAARADDRDWLDEEEMEPDPSWNERRDARRATAGRPNRLAALAGPGAGRNGGMRRGLLVGGAIVVLVLGAIGVYQFGAPNVPPITGTPNPSAAAGVDQAKVAADMQKLVANPNDTATFQDLANLYYAGGDYATAQTWLQKILAIDPKNVAALLGSGAAAFNLNDLKTAETTWQAVLAIDEKNVEAHYDLGFMYLSENPPDMAKVNSEWNEVIALAPDSDIAKTIATHLASLNGSPAPSPVASPG